MKGPLRTLFLALFWQESSSFSIPSLGYSNEHVRLVKISKIMKKKNQKPSKTSCIHRTQTPTCLRYLILTYDLTLSHVSQEGLIGCRLFLLCCTLLPSMKSVEEIGLVSEIWCFVYFVWYLTFDHWPWTIGTKYEVCWFNRIWNMENCMQKT